MLLAHRPDLGFSLLEVLLAITLLASTASLLGSALRYGLGMMRLETSLIQLGSLLRFARNEARLSGKRVLLCSVQMRINQMVNGCKFERKGGQIIWPQGLLVYRENVYGYSTAYDKQEDLRDLQFPPGVSAQTRTPVYRLLPGDMADPDSWPYFVLKERVSGQCVELWFNPQSSLLTLCRGTVQCQGCRL